MKMSARLFFILWLHYHLLVSVSLYFQKAHSSKVEALDKKLVIAEITNSSSTKSTLMSLFHDPTQAYANYSSNKFELGHGLNEFRITVGEGIGIEDLARFSLRL